MAGKHGSNMRQGSLKELHLPKRKGLSRREGIILTKRRHHPHLFLPSSQWTYDHFPLSNNFSRKVNPLHILGVLGPGLELIKIRLYWKNHHNSRVRVGPMGTQVKKVSTQVWSDSQGDDRVQRTKLLFLWLQVCQRASSSCWGSLAASPLSLL